jgi:hypothetical protein
VTGAFIGRVVSTADGVDEPWSIAFTPGQQVHVLSAANVAPTGMDGTVLIDEDTDYVFLDSDFGFDDGTDGDSFHAIVIGTISGGGSLSVGSTVLAGGETVLVSDIQSGLLQFTPVRVSSILRILAGHLSVLEVGCNPLLAPLDGVHQGAPRKPAQQE